VSLTDLFVSFWWLIFPIFGMAMGFWGMISSERRSARVLDLIKSYVDQGKEPPAELLKLATSDEEFVANSPAGRRQNNSWSFVVFAALAAGFGVGYYFVRAEDYAFAFLIVAVVMAVMAVGALFIVLTSRANDK
jgi:hypothetical protein